MREQKLQMWLSGSIDLLDPVWLDRKNTIWAAAAKSSLVSRQSRHCCELIEAGLVVCCEFVAGRSLWINCYGLAVMD